MNLYNASMGGDEPEMALTMEEFEEAKVDIQSRIERGQAAKRLANNPDFKLLVMEGYFKAEVDRLVGLITSGSISTSVRDGCAISLDAIGKCRSYLMSATQEGITAEDELKDLIQARDDALEAAANGETLSE